MKKYKNPILNCDFSDPDVIRVKDTYYLVSSSFNFMPGLPVLKSKNLVNWEFVNFACREIPFEIYNTPQHGKGIWAPSIREHNGEFFIFAGTPDEGIFYTKASSPEKEWSPLKCVKPGKGFEDPCPLWDDDGRLFIVHGFVKSRIGFNSKLGMFELNPETMEMISDSKIIFDGTVTQPTIEGPKFYKRNGWYYIFAPAGGVETGWQTVLRSKNVDGPWEEKIVLKQGSSKVNGPHQGAWVDSTDGKNWFIHFQHKGIMGRIVHMQPMIWENDWPVIGNNGEPLDEWECDFDGEQKNYVEGMDFQTLCNKTNDIQDLTNSLWYSKAVKTKMVDKDRFDYMKTVQANEFKLPNVRKGVIFTGDQYCSAFISHQNEEFFLEFVISEGDGDAERSEVKLFSEKLNGFEKVNLKIHFELIGDKKGKINCSAEVYSHGQSYEINFPEFLTVNAHWVGGRYGYF